MNQLHKLIRNLTYVRIDREAARDHWWKMAEISQLSNEVYAVNRHMVVEQKAVAGILSHKQTRGFIMHRMRERSLLRRLEREQRELARRSTFKLTYNHWKGGPWQSRLIEAHDVSEAHQKLLDLTGGVWSIRSTSVQCSATKKDGEPCQRFSYEEYCGAHRPKEEWPDREYEGQYAHACGYHN